MIVFVMNYLPDTSVVIAGILSDEVKRGLIKGNILIHNSVIAELEHQANSGQEIGLIGLNEVKTLRELSDEGLITLEFIGDRPNAEQIKYAKKGEIDALIRQEAFNNKAVLVTADLVQARSGEALGVKTKYYDLKSADIKLTLRSFFKKNVLSVNLIENKKPVIKDDKGLIVKGRVLTHEVINSIADNAEEVIRIKGKVILNRKGLLIALVDDLKIIITRPPVSNLIEVSVFRKQFINFVSNNIIKQLISSNGLLVCGKPFSGKTSLIKEVINEFNGVVKVINSPEYDINYYSISNNLSDLMVSINPDLIIIDGVNDLKLFTDLRIKGLRVFGVINNDNLPYLIQRLSSKFNLTLIPEVINKVIIIDKLKIKKVYELLFNDKLIIKDLLTNKIDYELTMINNQLIIKRS